MTVSVALFNNKGGVGKTTLTYHLAYMLNRLGYRVLAVDLDPQSNLTSMCLTDSELETLWSDEESPERTDAKLSDVERVQPGQTVADAVKPILEGTGDVKLLAPTELQAGLWLLPGSIMLSGFEDMLSQSWLNSFSGQPAALRTTTAFHRLIASVNERLDADLILIDVGPNLGAINRAALLSSDYILVPLAADLFSLKGLSNLGPTLRKWRDDWQNVILAKVPPGIDAPRGDMRPLGYVIMQPSMRLDRPVQAYNRWLKRIPKVYASSVLDGYPDQHDEIATLRNYRSLMPLSHDARKPMFDLRAGDGAIGGMQDYVQTCFADFKELTRTILKRLGLAERP
jgi:cellulose biosynthesis protein BcsQ